MNHRSRFAFVLMLTLLLPLIVACSSSGTAATSPAASPAASASPSGVSTASSAGGSAAPACRQHPWRHAGSFSRRQAHGRQCACRLQCSASQKVRRRDARKCYALCVSIGTTRCSIKQATATKGTAATVSGNRASSRAQRRNFAIQAKLRSTTHRRGSNTKPRLAFAPLVSVIPRALPAFGGGLDRPPI